MFEVHFSVVNMLRRLRPGRRLFVAMTLMAASVVAHAHKLNLFTYVEKDTIYVDGYFADGNKARNSAVTIHNGARELLIEGVTNDEGQFNFKVSAPTDIHITLNAGLGHQAEATIAASEFGAGATPAPAAGSASTSASTTGAARNPTGNNPVTATAATTIDPQQIEAAVQHAVSEGLRPLAKEIMALREKSKVSDMIGGVGFIVGAFGLWAFFNARRAPKPTPAPPSDPPPPTA